MTMAKIKTNAFETNLFLKVEDIKTNINNDKYISLYFMSQRGNFPFFNVAYFK